MAWELTSDVETFAETAGDFLRSSPVRHTVFLTLIDNLRVRGRHAYGPGDPFFGWWTTPSGAVGGVLLQTPPHPVLFSSLPAGAASAAATVLADRSITAVNMAAGDIADYAGSRPFRAGMRTRLFRLGDLTPPDPPPSGYARPATVADRELLIRWVGDFERFIGEPPEDVAEVVDDHLSYAGVTLWVDGDEPVAMAVRSRPQAGMVRILRVWTPPELRRRGYAGGATTAATRAALDAGAGQVVLYTDLANPTSNALYQRLGYRPVEDRAVVRFR
ncbi:RimJ/RimL family protein N-acetyltransferase [Actinoplanes octamycinicus]|uniref:RimJ/RimL family protein N-acetyltransferase n=1 Tax=Actinoplanes octamycinicus TaxID=135948 RepID=A0A7W7GUZ6_9ACTN|nr:GNAT family N-acetyltransferase [Actinoplanes octamycinicus]MBB4738800.1 RimJ/RimL family protein N-acetyltransferase [Actinoplanes octamycinicus]GIE63802.1 N-acetyltransferase [Actinoplanes octamycinicus]